MHLRIIALITILLLVASCSNISKPQQLKATGPSGTVTLKDLESLHADSSGISDIFPPNKIRNNGVKESAMAVGAQAGLAYRSEQIGKILEKNDAYLRQIFDFNALLLRDNVIPPVLEEGRDSLKIDDPNTIRLADRTYKIVEQARFVTSTPTWRNYLEMRFQSPTKPDNTLLPSNKQEQKIWKQGLEIGWKAGILQANNMFAANLARLKRDYKGMALYRALLAQNMVSMPYVAKANLGVTGGGANLRINDQVLRITTLPELKPDAKSWNPVMVPGN